MKKCVMGIVIVTFMIIALYLLSPYLLGINCEENNVGNEVIGLNDNCPYDEEGNWYYFAPVFYVSNAEQKMMLNLYNGEIVLEKDGEQEFEQLYLNLLVREQDSSKIYYYTSQYVTVKSLEKDGEAEEEKEGKKGNGFITIDTTKGTAKLFMLNSIFGRFKSVNLEKQTVFGDKIW